MSYTIADSTSRHDPSLTVAPGHLVALVDVDSMFVSCERIFNPTLWGRPVVVLSNNDGCVIARSHEAKQLGITMCQPWFEIAAHRPLAAQVTACSSNYELYGDISRRMMSILREFTPYVHVYSIDEAFLLLPQKNALGIAADIRDRLHTCLNLPVTIGIGATKTLAKVSSHSAKHNPKMRKISIIDTPDTPDTPDVLRQVSGEMRESIITIDYLNELPVQELWGVGRRLAHRFRLLGIHTAYDLYTADPAMIRKKFSITQERIVTELNGKPAIRFYDNPTTQQQVIYSRLFGKAITTRYDMAYALAHYADISSRRLRAQHLVAGTVTISASTSYHDLTEVYTPRITSRLFIPTNNTVDIIRATEQLLPLIHEGIKYVRASIIYSDLTPQHSTLTLFDHQNQYAHKTSHASTKYDDTRRSYNTAHQHTISPSATGCHREPSIESSAQAEQLSNNGFSYPTSSTKTYGTTVMSSSPHLYLAVVDAISERFGRKSIGHGYAGIKNLSPWDTRREKLSPAYSTQWHEIPTVR